MRLVVTGGGTGGHIYPAIAVALRIQKDLPGSDITYIGSVGGPEKASAIASGLPFEGLDVAGVAGKNPLNALAAIFKFFRASIRCRRLFREIRPEAVFSTGGYASAPACLAAVTMRLPLVLHEMNFDAGLVVKLFSRRAAAVATAFEGTRALLPKGTRCVVTGVPVRPEIESLSGDEAYRAARTAGIREFALEEGRKTLLVFGGSQGADALNRATWESIQDVRDDEGLQVLHLTGKKNFDNPERKIAEELVCEGGLRYRPLAYIEKMQLAYAVADLAVSRSGAGTVAELVASRLPSVLVPFPFSAGGHQERNAEALAETGSAVVALQEDGSAAGGLERAFELLSDDQALKGMRQAASVHAESAAEGIARLLEEVS